MSCIRTYKNIIDVLDKVDTYIYVYSVTDCIQSASEFVYQEFMQCHPNI